MADYGKQKSAKPRRNRPSHEEHNAPGGPANPFGANVSGGRPDKAALLERMREAARAKAGEPDEPATRPEGDA